MLHLRSKGDQIPRSSVKIRCFLYADSFSGGFTIAAVATVKISIAAAVVLCFGRRLINETSQVRQEYGEGCREAKFKLSYGEKTKLCQAYCEFVVRVQAWHFVKA